MLENIQAFVDVLIFHATVFHSQVVSAGFLDFNLASENNINQTDCLKCKERNYFISIKS